jgi:hypothetical protein
VFGAVIVNKGHDGLLCGLMGQETGKIMSSVLSIRNGGF